MPEEYEMTKYAVEVRTDKNYHHPVAFHYLYTWEDTEYIPEDVQVQFREECSNAMTVGVYVTREETIQYIPPRAIKMISLRKIKDIRTSLEVKVK